MRIVVDELYIRGLIAKDVNEKLNTNFSAGNVFFKCDAPVDGAWIPIPRKKEDKNE